MSLGIADAAEAAEVDLQLIARLIVVHPDRRSLGRAADAELFERSTVQRPLRYNHSLPVRQLMDLDNGEPVGVEPLDQLVPVHFEQPARLALAVGA